MLRYRGDFYTCPRLLPIFALKAGEKPPLKEEETSIERKELVDQSTLKNVRTKSE